ncbi:collagen binding domain-containing protein [Streptomyces sp. NPDC059070]|uniref:MSCRAMM family protein n=1 Tax=Streptomyces sp. NPDC059070 TaxID=3346713 RepID=UPI0036C68124
MPYRPFLLAPLALTTAAVLVAAPAATAAVDPSPSPAAATTQHSESAPADKGGLRITAKDPEGTAVPGAVFQLLDATGTKLADGTTATDGTLLLNGLAPGIVRLKETSPGSPLLATVPDQDIVIAGDLKTLEITSPYRPAALTLKVTDKASGKGLPGVVVNIAPKGAKDTQGNVTLTTGKDGTATASLPVGKKTGSLYTATETQAPAGYRPATTPLEITAKPATQITATLTHTNASTAKPTTDPTVKPTTQPSPASSSPTAGATTSGTPAPDASASTSTGTAAPATASADASAGDQTSGSLAHTGASRTTWWLLGTGGILLTAGAGAFCATRRRKKTGPDTTGTGQHRRTH